MATKYIILNILYVFNYKYNLFVIQKIYINIIVINSINLISSINCFVIFFFWYFLNYNMKWFLVNFFIKYFMVLFYYYLEYIIEC